MTHVTDITFNTGRRYTQEGQVIRAIFDPEKEEIRFNDFSRMIAGVFACSSINAFRSAHGLAERVMHAYDHGGYEWTGSFEREEGAEVHGLRF